MAVYAIGDVQGCYDELQRLLDKIAFDDSKDQLWFAGDLINRGPKSLETLRFVRNLKNTAITVLGNHDLNLLAVAAGVRQIKARDTLQDILQAPDCEELLDWLRHQPLIHHDKKLGYTMVHAGLPPQWDLKQATSLAAEVEACLQSDDFIQFLQGMYGDQPNIWSENLTGIERFRFITNCFTRLRFCTAEGRLEMENKGAIGTQPEGYYPWFSLKKRKNIDLKIIFGHWSTLENIQEPDIYPLDTGCVWGSKLTAMQLDTDSESSEKMTCVSCGNH